MIFFAMSTDSQAAEEPVKVSLTTSKGTIELELYPDKAPKTVANFVEYVNAGYYEGTIFHRLDHHNYLRPRSKAKNRFS